MVGSPGQTAEHLAEDFQFIRELQPEMVGIGPFIPHSDTPFAKEIQGSMELTRSNDIFLYHTVTKTAKPKDSDSSSGGSRQHK